MDTEYLNYLLEIYKTGSMTRAAENLFVSQSNLSQFLKNTENRIGEKLFVRENKKYTPTKVGMLYIQYAEEVTKLTQNLHEQVAQLSAPQSVSIGSASSIDAKVLRGVISKMEKRYPSTEFSLTDCDNIDFIKFSLDNKTLGATCTTIPSLDFFKRPAVWHVGEELLLAVPSSICASKGLKIQDPMRNTMTLHDVITTFGDSPYIFQHHGSCIRYLIDGFFEKENFTPNLVSHVSGANTLRDMVKRGMGLGFIPMLNAISEENVVYFHLSPSVIRHHAFVINTGLESNYIYQTIASECHQRFVTIFKHDLPDAFK
ncbi:MAG: LysR family transcriptional regulator [Lachnospiraceae bacterium]|jgi:LysR family transcriptional activator of glutamate synthase operon